MTAVGASRAGLADRLVALFLALRPKQWTKNALLFAGLLFTLDAHHPPADFVHAAVAFALFCLLSGCAYLVNDIRDAAADRLHPQKRLRPIASGRLPVGAAWAFTLIVTPLTLAAGWLALGHRFTLVALAYFVLTLSYSFGLKNVVIVDVMAVAAGFVLRAVAGAAALPVRVSEWLLLCTFLLALFVALMKRRAEITALGNGTATRPILAEYSLPYLDKMVTLVATTCLVSYLLYTVLSPTGRQHPYLMATSPFVLYGLFRYLYLVHQKGMGEAPEVILLRDKPLLVNLALWVCSVILALLVRRVSL
jgi:4-hydroxybenzoate polyprenyltransferase